MFNAYGTKIDLVVLAKLGVEARTNKWMRLYLSVVGALLNEHYADGSIGGLTYGSVQGQPFMNTMPHNFLDSRFLTITVDEPGDIFYLPFEMLNPEYLAFFMHKITANNSIIESTFEQVHSGKAWVFWQASHDELWHFHKSKSVASESKWLEFYKAASVYNPGDCNMLAGAYTFYYRHEDIRRQLASELMKFLPPQEPVPVFQIRFV